MEDIAHLVGLVPLVLAAALGIGLGLRALFGDRPRVLALQFPRDAADVRALVGKKPYDPRRSKAFRSIDLDTRVFIPVYWAALTALAVLFAFRDRSWAPWVGGAAAGAATVAALLDLVENERTLRVLETPTRDTTYGMVRDIRAAAHKKWAAAVLATALLAAVLATDDPPDLARGLGVVFAAAAIVGVTGFVYRPALVLFLLVTAAAVAASFVALAFYIDDFTNFFRY